MSNRAPTFSHDEKQLLRKIREDITKRPDVYRPGVDYLLREYSVDEMLRRDVKKWKSLREIVKKGKSPRKVERKGKSPRKVEPPLQAPSRPAVDPPLKKPKATDGDYLLCNRLSTAAKELVEGGLHSDNDFEPYDMVKVVAVLALMWLLTDPDADKNPLGTSFGPWQAPRHRDVSLWAGEKVEDEKDRQRNEEFALTLMAKGRGMVRRTMDMSGSGLAPLRKQWMDLVRRAWDTMQETQPEAAQGEAEGAGVTVHGVQHVFPAGHYNTKYGIPADRLAAARRDGRIQGARKEAGRWQYPFAEVSRLWPEDFTDEPARSR